ncbi:MAG TPA: selenocysteine-specific translation elongation factor [Kofleriaceae bacterium]|nr:selenocysteine-specific translation elongation factor [Kofleriaceae bacterium]
MPIVVGTAGHIDHGKTALVKALTGIDTDRLPIEKQRGITTELGFAPLELAGQRIAMVDVPGHERFVKSMVAGATGIDVVVMVIAADEGTMPQTREHLAICDLLGVQRGVIAVTKSDLVDAEGLALARADITAAVAGTFLEHAAVVPVSVRTGTGLDELRAALRDAISTVTPRATTGVFRLAIDRVFTKKGFGTIVTGTVLGGEVRTGDELHVIPSGLAARVRGLEVHGAAVDVASAGQRCAINLGGVAVEDLARGDMVVHPERVLGSHILDVELRTLDDLPARSKVLLHHGTAQVLATLVRLDGTLAQLRIDRETPLGALPGDHFIVRGFERSPLHGSTLGGGTIIRVLAPKARRSHADVVAALARAKLDQQLVHFVRASATTGLTATQLGQRTGIADLAATLATLVQKGELVAQGERFLAPEVVAVHEPKPQLVLEPIDQQVLAKLEATGVEPPRPKELAGAMGLTDAAVKPALERLLAAKLVTKIKPDLVMHARVVADIRTRLLAFLAEHGTIDAQQWKDLTGASRKFTIPLAEFFDAEKLTLRIGDVRRKR